MIKHFFSVFIIVFVFFFIYFISSTYISKNNKEKINSNRINPHLKIKDSLSVLPILKNDTNNVIVFNSGYNDVTNEKKRNFWDLFKKND